jgi:hypothetical protein
MLLTHQLSGKVAFLIIATVAIVTGALLLHAIHSVDFMTVAEAQAVSAQ